MIKIGITSGFLYPDPSRRNFAPKTLCFLENDMANYLYRQNVMPILIPGLEGDALTHFVSELDAVVFQGGSDVSPKSYDEQFLDQDRWPGDYFRDEYELSIARVAFAKQKPMLGICRGAQLLNVFFGGKLYQDLQQQFSKKQLHHDRDQYDRLIHDIEFVPGGLLEQIYKDVKSPKVNSIHHQGISQLAPDLRVEARCAQDQLIEAYSYHGATPGFVLGIQWHPEFSETMANHVLAANQLYLYFIEKIKQGVK